MLGIAILVLPLAGVASLALLVAAFLFAGGITRTALALRFKPRRGWGWVLFDGLLSIGLAILIAIGWPQSSLAFVGLLTRVHADLGGDLADHAPARLDSLTDPGSATGEGSCCAVIIVVVFDFSTRDEMRPE